jgi:hypothetical protein
MRVIYILVILTATVAVFTGCGSNQPSQQATNVANVAPYTNNANVDDTSSFEDEDFAKEDFDLQRVGPIIKRAKSPQEFEYYLNQPDGINNLDLNGDGYADYISVEEYPFNNDYERGLSMYTRFGPDEVQELGTVVFYRDEPNYPGARVLLTGNQNLYGDNVYYETNWLDQTIGLVTSLFTNRDVYRSPYYYDYYPPNYVTYQVVETPVYVSRVERLYPEPLFVYTQAPTIIEKVKTRSPNNGRSMQKVFAKFAKPTKEQAEFRKNNPNRPEFARHDNGRRPNENGKENGQAKNEEKHDRGTGQEKQQNKENKGGNPEKGGQGKGKKKGQ